MKKVFLTFAVFIFFTTLISAEPQLNFYTGNFTKGETIVGEIFLDENENFASDINNLNFYEGRKQTFFQKDLFEYKDKYYFYFYASREGNFTLEITDILYEIKQDNEQGVLKESSIEKNFTISKGNSISIKPGIFYTTEKPEITLTNNFNNTINLTYSFSSQASEEGFFDFFSSEETNETTLAIEKGESKSLVVEPQKEFSFLYIKSNKTYRLPIVYLKLEKNETTSEEKDLELSEKLIHMNLEPKERQNATIEIFNFAESNATNLTFTKNSSSYSINEIKTLPAKSSANLTLEFYTEKTGALEDDLVISYKLNNKSKSLTLKVYIYSFPENLTSEQIEEEINECEKINGTICSLDEECEGELTYSGGFCCIGTCVKTESEGESFNYKWLIGILIFVILAVVGFFIYKKYKKSPQAETPLENSQKEYSERTQGNISRT